jgi:hypothetical protein
VLLCDEPNFRADRQDASVSFVDKRECRCSHLR